MKTRFLVLWVGLLLTGVLAFGAAADGTWVAEGAQNAGVAPTSLVLQTSGGTLTGTANGVQISNGQVYGNFINFVVVKAGTSYSYKGTISGTTLDLHQSVTSDGSQYAHVTLTKTN
jgi:hypothetical protein